ncbi:MAG: ArsR/SmtB family transcription factor [Segniliparus sp.]|uniref:ArsR/SmtB family transcription factor n=1 Tax=Segniliparus sp. TaxID=2804064 RepID=UPI003F41B13C
MRPEADKVFKALADPTRRSLLDRLREQNGQTLGQLCEGIAMTRQAATQHLAVLEAANLVAVARRGREKLHYLNPVPLHEIGQRWIDTFERPRLRALEAIKQRAEESMTVIPSYVYVTYIDSTPEKVWQALTDADLTASYWGHSNISDWQVGSPWEHRRTDGSGVADVVGTVLASDPPRKLVTTWAEPSTPDAVSRVVFDIKPHGTIVQLTVTHENLPDEAALRAISGGWPAVLSNLKSLLETGSPLSEIPWRHLGE